MSNAEKYKDYFTKEYLMGPNSFRLLDELISRSPENYARIKDNNLEDTIIPIHGDAMDMPFAQGYFDTIISVDSYHYFGCKEKVFAEKILPFVKKDGYVMIAIPGLKEEPQGELKEIFSTWAEGDDSELFKTVS